MRLFHDNSERRKKNLMPRCRSENDVRTCMSGAEWAKRLVGEKVSRDLARDTPNERASPSRSSGALQTTYRKFMGGKLGSQLSCSRFGDFFQCSRDELQEHKFDFQF